MWNRIRTAATFTLSLGTVVMLGCGGGEGGGEATEGAGSGGAATAPAESPVDAGTAGNVTGMVMLNGTPPAMTPIDMSDEPTCAEKHDGQPTSQEVVASGGHLGNVFVYVKEGLENLQFPTPTEEVVIDQDGCVYIPHVSGVMVGQDLTFENSDGLLHNINATPEENRGFNISQPVEMQTTRTFPAPEVMIPIRCDVHGWMSAYVGVLPHPYYAVTSTDGSFDLSTLPPGDYVIEAWHERYGAQTQNVTVATGETAEVTFTFDASATAYVPLGEPLDPHDHHGDRGAPVAAGGDR